MLQEAKSAGLTWSEVPLAIDRERSMCGFTCARLFVLERAL